MRDSDNVPSTQSFTCNIVYTNISLLMCYLDIKSVLLARWCLNVPTLSCSCSSSKGRGLGSKGKGFTRGRGGGGGGVVLVGGVI